MSAIVLARAAAGVGRLAGRDAALHLSGCGAGKIFDAVSRPSRTM